MQVQRVNNNPSFGMKMILSSELDSWKRQGVLSAESLAEIDSAKAILAKIRPVGRKVTLNVFPTGVSLSARSLSPVADSNIEVYANDMNGLADAAKKLSKSLKALRIALR